MSALIRNRRAELELLRRHLHGESSLFWLHGAECARLSVLVLRVCTNTAGQVWRQLGAEDVRSEAKPGTSSTFACTTGWASISAAMQAAAG